MKHVIALDATTLEERFRFNTPCYAFAIAVVYDELIIGGHHRDMPTADGRLIVYSLLGEYRREISGEWGTPRHVHFVRDRLYLVEWTGEEEEEEEEEESLDTAPNGRRVFVLSPQGETLQIFKVPHSVKEIRDLTSLGDNLIVLHQKYGPQYGLPSRLELMALKGL